MTYLIVHHITENLLIGLFKFETRDMAKRYADHLSNMPQVGNITIMDATGDYDTAMSGDAVYKSLLHIVEEFHDHWYPPNKSLEECDE